MNFEKYRDQYVNKQELLTSLYEQQKYGSTQDSRGRAKAILTIMNFPYIKSIEKSNAIEKNNNE